MAWKKIKLGEVLTNRDARFKPNDKAIINIKRIDKINFLGQIFLSDKGSNTDMIIIKKGDLVISGINVEKGAIAVYEGDEDITATIHYSSYEFNRDKIDIDFLKVFLRSPNFVQLLKQQVPGGIKTEIKPKHILPLEVYFPDTIEKQKEIAKLFFEKEKKFNDLGKHLSYQLTQLENLNYTILQEAVQGKLVPQKPADEPASQLLKRIKAEKETLRQSQGGGKKEKHLPPIKPEEIPFEIPESWVWCRLGEVCEKIHYGFNASAKPNNTGVRLLRITDIQNNSVDWETVPGCDYTKSDLENYLLNENDIVIARTGGTIGKTFLVKNIPLQSLFASYLIRAIPSKSIFPEYAKYYMESPIYWKQLYDAAGGAAQPNVNGTSLSNLAFPLPPLSEQTRIVAEIEKQLAKTKQLKEHILANQQATEQLLKALLHEAFEVSEAKEVKAEKKEAKVIEFKPKKCSEPEKAILAGHIINVNNSDDFGRVKLQKLLHLTEYYCKIDLDSHYVQRVAGPHDEELIKNIESALQRYRFYKIKQDKHNSGKVTYITLETASELDTLFAEHFKTETSRINDFILKFKKSSWEQCEIISTLYAVWNNRIIKRQNISDELLMQDFLNWNKQKIKYKDRLENALIWMRTQKIIPDGWGKYIDKPKTKKK